MARRKLTEAEEAQIIAAAEEEQDAQTGELDLVRPVIGAGTTAVLSVRLPIEELRAIRKLAEARRTSVSALLHDAITLLLSQPGPNYSRKVDTMAVVFSAGVRGSAFVDSRASGSMLVWQASSDAAPKTVSGRPA